MGVTFAMKGMLEDVDVCFVSDGIAEPYGNDYFTEQGAALDTHKRR
jgi:hypothetical protein